MEAAAISVAHCSTLKRLIRPHLLPPPLSPHRLSLSPLLSSFFIVIEIIIFRISVHIRNRGLFYRAFARRDLERDMRFI